MEKINKAICFFEDRIIQDIIFAAGGLLGIAYLFLAMILGVIFGADTFFYMFIIAILSICGVVTFILLVAAVVFLFQRLRSACAEFKERRNE